MVDKRGAGVRILGVCGSRHTRQSRKGTKVARGK